MNCYFRKKIEMTAGSQVKTFLNILLITGLLLMSNSCDSMKRMQRQEDRRMAASKKKIEQQKQEREKVYQKQAERQKDIQTKETRKQMKELERKSKRWRDGKPEETFYERWWYKMSESRDRRRERRRD
jgi:hypothetical protein